MAAKKSVSKAAKKHPKVSTLGVTAALTKGQKMVLYILLSTRSQLRFSVEGIFGNNYGTKGPGPVKVLSDINTRLDVQLQKIFPSSQVDHTSLSDSSLLVPLGSSPLVSGGVTTDPARLRSAVGMDDFYDPTGDPCPSDFSNLHGTGVTQTNDQANLIKGILTFIP
jgi:hypothetical protein